MALTEESKKQLQDIGSTLAMDIGTGVAMMIAEEALETLLSSNIKESDPTGDRSSKPTDDKAVLDEKDLFLIRRTDIAMLYAGIVPANINHIGRHSEVVLQLSVLVTHIDLGKRALIEFRIVGDTQGHIGFKSWLIPDQIVCTGIISANPLAMGSQE